MIVNTIWVSLIRLCNDMIQEMKDEGQAAPAFIDWEAHAATPELPNSDLLGPTAFALTEDEGGILEASFAIAASSYGEEHLFRHRYMIDKLFSRLRVEKQINLVHPETGHYAGKLIITDGTTMSPMSRANLRPFQFVQAQAVIQIAEGTGLA